MKRGCTQDRHGRVLASLALPRFADHPFPRPLVVALEGPNGAGKTTLSRLLADRFAAPACMGTDSDWLSDAFKVRMIRDAEWFSAAMFFFSGCCEQMRVLRGAAHPLVIMDRSLWSTLAVHGGEDAQRLGRLLDMLRPVAGQIQVPDLTLVLETSFATCQSRIARKSGVARLLDEATATAEFHAHEQEFYRWLSRQRPEVRLLDANEAGPEELAKQAAALISEKSGAPRQVSAC